LTFWIKSLYYTRFEKNSDVRIKAKLSQEDELSCSLEISVHGSIVKELNFALEKNN